MSSAAWKADKLGIDESVPEARAHLRAQHRAIYASQSTKALRISSEIMKGTLTSTVGSVLNGLQFYYLYQAFAGDTILLEVLFWVLVAQTYLSFSLVAL